MKYDLIVETWKRYINEEQTSIPSALPTVPTTTTVSDSTAQQKPTEQEEKQKSIDTIVGSVENSLHDASALANKMGIDKATLRTQLKAQIDKVIAEKKRAKVVKKSKSGDRCTRIAKRKYDVWPSAYASGAVVKCRQGKIWKGISEDMSDEEIDEALLLEEVEILEEKWSDKYKRSINCKNPKGFSQKAHCQGRKKK